MEQLPEFSSHLQEPTDKDAGADAAPWTVLLQPEEFNRRAKCFSAVSITGPIKVAHTYDKNKVRQYPPAITPEQTKKRAKAKQSLRIFRAKQRALYTLLQKQTVEATRNNRSLKLRLAKQRAYVRSLRQLLGTQNAEDKGTEKE